MINLKQLFTKYRINWHDHGPNCSPGNVNIPCPFCKNDPSWHLAINETSGEYYCFRNPKHCGPNPLFIFRVLKIPPFEYKDQKFAETKREYVPDQKSYTLFRFFDPAEENAEAIAYLEKRLFTRPIDTAKKFGLKTDKIGRWAGRLIIPLTVGWTGRSMRPHIEPRYLAETSQDGYYIFKYQKTSSLILLEGAVDAMKVATVSSQFDVIAKCGNRLSPALLTYLREKQYMTIFNTPDGNVPYAQSGEETRILKSYCTRTDVIKMPMPDEVKDFGEMTEHDARQWLNHAAINV